ncbi:MAG: hypothetical protein AAGH90_10345 [Pseudomonadota bacterium]
MALSKIPDLWKAIIVGVATVLGIAFNRLIVPEVFPALGWAMPSKPVHSGIGFILIGVFAWIGFALGAKIFASADNESEDPK